MTLTEARPTAASAGAAQTRRSRRRRSRPGPLRRALRAIGPGEVDAERRRGWLLPLVCAAAASAFILVRLLVPVAVGLADQGDGTRLLCQLGVASTAPFDYTAQRAHLVTSWAPHAWYGEACGVDGSGERFVSSQTLLLLPAKALTPVLGWGEGLDTRAVGILCALVVGVLAGALVRLLPGRPPFRVLVAAAVVLVLADGVFAGFYVSPYVEPAALLGLVAVFVALLHHGLSRAPIALRLLPVAAATAFAACAQPQMVAVIPVVTAAVLWPRAGRGGERHAVLTRVLTGATALLLLALGAGYLAVQPSRTAEVTAYNAVFTEVLPHSPDPRADLAWFGIDPMLARAAGSGVDSAGVVMTAAQYRQVVDAATPLRVAAFFAVHPERLVFVADRGLQAVTAPELSGLGSYPADSGEVAGAKEARVPVAESALTVMGALPLSVLVLQLLAIVLGWAVAARSRLGERATAFGRSVVTLVACGAAVFWTVAVTTGAAAANRTLLPTALVTALCLPLVVALIALLARRGAAGA